MSIFCKGESEDTLKFLSLTLMSKGEKYMTYCHQCQRGRLLEIWQIAEMMQNVKVVIDGNLLWQRQIDDGSERSSGRWLVVSRPDRQMVAVEKQVVSRPQTWSTSK